MRETLKRFLKLAAGYSLVTLLGPLFTVFLTPLYTRVLTPADYGVVDIALTLASFCVMFAVLGMDQSLSAYFFKSETPEHQRNLVTTAVLCAIGISTALGMGLILIAQPIALWLYKDATRSITLYVLALHIVAAPVFSIVTSALRLRMGIKRVNALALTSLLVTVSANLILVLGLRLKATGIIAANAITSWSMALFGILLAWQPLRGRFDPHLARLLLRVGSGLLVGAFCWSLLSNADRLILTQYVSQTDIGLYSIANKLATMAYVLLSAAWNAWWPIALEMADRPEAPRQYARMFDGFMAASMFTALGLGILAPEILSVFARAIYTPAAPYTLALLIHYGPLAFIGGYMQIGLYARQQLRWVTLSAAIAAVLNIVLNFALDAWLGAWGAVWATVVASLAWVVCLYFPSRRALPIPFHWRRVAGMGSVYLILVCFFLLVPSLNTLPIKLLSLTGFGLVILSVGVVSLAELRQLAQAAWQRL